MNFRLLIPLQVRELSKLSAEVKKKLWLGPEFEKVRNSYDILTGQDSSGDSGGPPKDKNGGETKTEIPTRAKTIISSFINTYDYIFSSKGADSFRILVKKQEFNEEEHKNLVKTNRKSRWQGDSVMKDPGFYHELQIICMSPAVAFQDFKFTRSVLLASGTLRLVSKITHF